MLGDILHPGTQTYPIFSPPILPPAIVTVGVPESVSLVRKVRVTVFPLVAHAELTLLLEVIDTEVKNGLRVSTVTVDESVVLVAVAVLPAGSLTVTEKVTAPSAVVPATVL